MTDNSQATARHDLAQKKRSQAVQTKTVALLFVIFWLVDELHENINVNVGIQITSLRAIAHTS